jgi:hypothetical protein
VAPGKFSSESLAGLILSVARIGVWHPIPPAVIIAIAASQASPPDQLDPSWSWPSAFMPKFGVKFRLPLPAERR